MPQRFALATTRRAVRRTSETGGIRGPNAPERTDRRKDIVGSIIQNDDAKNSACPCHHEAHRRHCKLFSLFVHGVWSGLTTQAQRPGPREAWIATVMRWPGSLQRMVRRSIQSFPVHTSKNTKRCSKVRRQQRTRTSRRCCEDTLDVDETARSSMELRQSPSKR
jgi:hypothetical protein